MSNIQIISLVLAGVNIGLCLVVASMCLGETKYTRKPFKAKNRMISVEGINSNNR